jgi:hypothetical protein
MRKKSGPTGEESQENRILLLPCGARMSPHRPDSRKVEKRRKAWIKKKRIFFDNSS